MPILTVEKALRSLRKTPVILDVLIGGLSQAEAVAATDGPEGWSVLLIVCHLSDFEVIHFERVRLILEGDTPTFPHIDNDELIEQNDYAAQELHAALARYLSIRREFYAFLESLESADWSQRGVHPVTGASSLLDVVINAALHDVDHLEQIIRALGSSMLSF